MNVTQEQLTTEEYQEAIGSIGYARAVIQREMVYSGVLFNWEYPEDKIKAAEPGVSLLGVSHVLPVDVRKARETADKLLYRRIDEALAWVSQVEAKRSARVRVAFPRWEAVGKPPQGLPVTDPHAIVAGEYYYERLGASQALFAGLELKAHQEVGRQGFQFQWGALVSQAKGFINDYSERALRERVSEPTRQAVIEYLDSVHLRSVQDANPDYAGSQEPNDVAGRRAAALTSLNLLRYAWSWPAIS